MRTDYEDTTVVLESRAVNPFKDWSDWYGTNGEAVVTFFTMKEQLWNRWSNDCVSISHEDCNHGDSWEDRMEQDEETGFYSSKDCNSKRVVEHEKFDPTDLQAPGVYLDGTHYDDDEKVDESYTVFVPFPFLSPELCRRWIQKLNEQYNRQFELRITEGQEQRAGGLEDAGMNRMRLEENADTSETEGGTE